MSNSSAGKIKNVIVDLGRLHTLAQVTFYDLHRFSTDTEPEEIGPVVKIPVNAPAIRVSNFRIEKQYEKWANPINVLENLAGLFLHALETDELAPVWLSIKSQENKLTISVNRVSVKIAMIGMFELVSASFEDDGWNIKVNSPRND